MRPPVQGLERHPLPVEGDQQVRERVLEVRVDAVLRDEHLRRERA
jgi:hypothetical protein